MQLNSELYSLKRKTDYEQLQELKSYVAVLMPLLI